MQTIRDASILGLLIATAMTVRVSSVEGTPTPTTDEGSAGVLQASMLGDVTDAPSEPYRFIQMPGFEDLQTFPTVDDAEAAERRVLPAPPVAVAPTPDAAPTADRSKAISRETSSRQSPCKATERRRRAERIRREIHRATPPERPAPIIAALQPTKNERLHVLTLSDDQVEAESVFRIEVTGDLVEETIVTLTTDIAAISEATAEVIGEIAVEMAEMDGDDDCASGCLADRLEHRLEALGEATRLYFDAAEQSEGLRHRALLKALAGP